MYGQYGNYNRGRGRGYGHGRGRGYGRGRGGRHNQSSIEDHNCILPLKSTLSNDKINKIKVKCRHSNTNVREAQIITFDSTVPYDKELLLRSYHDFMNNTGDDSLNCNSGDRLFQCYRQRLGATQKTKWDSIVAPYNVPGGPGRTPATFTTASLASVNEVLCPGAASKQRSYFDRLTSKPYSRGCQKVNHDFCKVPSKFNVALTLKYRLAHNLLTSGKIPGSDLEPGKFQGARHSG